MGVKYIPHNGGYCVVDKLKSNIGYLDKALIAQLNNLSTRRAPYAIAEYSKINKGSLNHRSNSTPYPNTPINTNNGAKNKYVNSLRNHDFFFLLMTIVISHKDDLFALKVITTILKSKKWFMFYE